MPLDHCRPLRRHQQVPQASTSTTSTASRTTQNSPSSTQEDLWRTSDDERCAVRRGAFLRDSWLGVLEYDNRSTPQSSCSLAGPSSTETNDGGGVPEYSLFLFYDYRSPPSLTSTIYDQDDLKASFTDCRIAQSGGVWRLAAGSTSSSTARLESSISALLGSSRDRGHSIFLSLRALTLVDVLGQSLVKEKRPMKYAFYLPCDLSGSTMVS